MVTNPMNRTDIQAELARLQEEQNKLAQVGGTAGFQSPNSQSAAAFNNTQQRIHTLKDQLKDSTDIAGMSLKDFDKKQKPFIREGAGAVSRQQNSAENQTYQDFINSQADMTNNALPGVKQFIENQFNRASGMDASQQAQNAQTQGTVNSALASLLGLSQGQNAQNLNNTLGTSGLQLTPELQNLVSQQRDLAIQRANIGVDQNANDRASQLTSQLAARGLSGSSVAARGMSDIQADILNQQENARIAAEQQALEREAQLRGMGLQSRQQDIQGNLGLLGQLSQNNAYAANLGNDNLTLGNNRLANIEQQMSQYGAPSELATLLQLGQQGNAPLNDFSQQQLQNELDALRLASGQQSAASQGGGWKGALGGLAGTAAGSFLGPIGAGIGGGIGKKLGGLF